MSVAAADREKRADFPPAPREAVRLRRRDGRWRMRPLSSTGHAALLAELLHAECPGFVEVVGVERGPDGRLGGFDRANEENFVPSGDRGALLSRLVEVAVGERREVFFTPATVMERRPRNEAVVETRVAWVDIDEPKRIARLRAFPHSPHAVVMSGSGGAHAYWRLAAPALGGLADETNRRLAGALGADLQSCNRGRIMRIPGTLNWKHTDSGQSPTWCRVVICDLAKAPYERDALVRGLADPRPAKEAPVRPSRRQELARSSRDEPWEEMPAVDYYRVITGLEPRRDGMVRCPNVSHEDRHPSAKLYPGPGAGWYCFACGAGGSAVDLVAALRGLPTGRTLQGGEFKECIAALTVLFNIKPAGGR